jgi:subtilase family serine protease
MYMSIFRLWLKLSVALSGAISSGTTRRKSYMLYIYIGTMLALVFNRCDAVTTTTLSDTFVTLDENIWSKSSY